MKIKILSLLCIVFIVLNFISRTLGSILPWFYIRWSGRGAGLVITMILNLLYLLFFINLYQEFYRQADLNLQRAALWPILGSTIAFLLEIRNALYTFTFIGLPGIIVDPFWDLLVPLFQSVAILYFLIIFQGKVRSRIIDLEKTAQAGIIGFTLAAVIYFLITLNFLIRGIIPPFYQIGRFTGFFILPIKIISTVFIISFFFQIMKNENKIAYIQEL